MHAKLPRNGCNARRVWQLRDRSAAGLDFDQTFPLSRNRRDFDDAVSG
jgi:hypothetical protein